VRGVHAHDAHLLSAGKQGANKFVRSPTLHARIIDRERVTRVEKGAAVQQGTSDDLHPVAHATERLVLHTLNYSNTTIQASNSPVR
jgi:hypothetical protein